MDLAKCNHEGCEREVYIQGETTYKKCVLHVPKHDWEKLTKAQSVAKPFYQEFLKYIMDDNLRKQIVDDSVTDEMILLFIRGAFEEIPDPAVNIKNIEKFIKEVTLLVGGIHFPPYDADSFSFKFSYIKVLQSFSKIEFDGCTFNESGWILEGVKVLYTRCHFRCDWTVYKGDLVIPGVRRTEGYNKIDFLYRDCVFYKGVKIGGGEEPKKDKEDKELLGFRTISLYNDEMKGRKGLLFLGCKFKGEIRFEKVIFDVLLFDDANRRYQTNVENIEFKGCVLNKRFSLNHQTNIKKFTALNTAFKGKFEFKNNVVSETSVYDCNFEELADFYILQRNENSDY